MAPPKRMKMSDVPGYVHQQYSIEVTRQTVYNWAKTGIRGVQLKTVRKAGKLFTTKGWVDAFVQSTGSN